MIIIMIIIQQNTLVTVNLQVKSGLADTTNASATFLAFRQLLG